MGQLCYQQRILPFEIQKPIFGENAKTKLRYCLITLLNTDYDSNSLEIYLSEKGRMNFRVIKPNGEAEKSYGTKHNDAERIKNLLGKKAVATYDVGETHSTHVLGLPNDEMLEEILIHPYKGRTIHGRLNLKNNTR